MVRCRFAVILTISLFSNAFCVPAVGLRRRRIPEDSNNSEISEDVAPIKASTSSSTTVSLSPNNDDDDDDDDDDFGTSSHGTSTGGGGSNLFSLLNLATSLMPASGSGSSGGNTNTLTHTVKAFTFDLCRAPGWWFIETSCDALVLDFCTDIHFTFKVKNNNIIVKKLIQDLIRINRNQIKLVQRRKDLADNVIDIDYTDIKPPLFQKLEELDDSDDDENDSDSEGSDEDNGGEESVEKESNENGGSKQDSASNGDSAGDNDDDDNDSDYDEPPEGDGQGGGILGLLAGLSGDGDSDLGTLLATVGGIVANLSGDGVDINALIATALGLLVGLLSEGNQNPGEIIGRYLLTSLDTITGGGAQNNGAFFGKFLSTLIKGTSAAGDPDASGSSENNGPKMADSAGFFASLLMGLLGEMSKTSSGSSWR
ncbi:myb-like protein V [Spodoptera litura]|uniref:Myb-like protein V n=1 Tax=Spodoptera litura TaxID=69820 RepID=A0A9J7IX40_SPOLT|nr:myb-like protein V [Spodoptera litura]